MTKMAALKDGTGVVIRDLTMEDLERSARFFQSIPPEDRLYLRVDVTKRANVEERIRRAEGGEVVRIVALVENTIVADGALELSGHGWRHHQGEIRTIVAQAYQKRGLGMIVMKELHSLAVDKGVEKVVCKMASPQTGARRICDRLGFRVEATLPNYVKDMNGEFQDLVVMTCTLDEMWRELRGFYAEHDPPDG